MFFSFDRLFVKARKYAPVVVPVVGVFFIGKYFYEENNNQQRYSQTRICPMETNGSSMCKKIESEDEIYRNIMFKYFSH